jgi:hypothetical protein
LYQELGRDFCSSFEAMLENKANFAVFSAVDWLEMRKTSGATRAGTSTERSAD